MLGFLMFLFWERSKTCGITQIYKKKFNHHSSPTPSSDSRYVLKTLGASFFELWDDLLQAFSVDSVINVPAGLVILARVVEEWVKSQFHLSVLAEQLLSQMTKYQRLVFSTLLLVNENELL